MYALNPLQTVKFSVNAIPQPKNHFNYIKNLIFIAVLVLSLTGCSSIISKTEYAVAIASEPPQSEFTVLNRDGAEVHSGITPATVTLKSSSGYFKGESYTIVFNKDGYSEKTFTMSSTVDGWYFGNILFGGLIGMLIVDPATGAMYNLPARVDVSLDAPLTDTSSKKITIATIDSLDPEQLANLVRLNP